MPNFVTGAVLSELFFIVPISVLDVNIIIIKVVHILFCEYLFSHIYDTKCFLSSKNYYCLIDCNSSLYYFANFVS